MEDDKDKKCWNCEHFIRYYVRMETTYRPVHCGCCFIKPSGGMRSKRINPDEYVCEKWMPLGNKAPETRSRIHRRLLDMAKQVNEMYIMLKQDENMSD